MNKEMLLKFFLRKCIYVVLVACFILTGCGKSPQPDFGTSEEEKNKQQEAYYKIEEYEIPDPDEALRSAGILPNDSWWCREIKRTFFGGKLYRLVDVKENVEDITGAFLNRANYVQVLEAPYKEWKNYEVACDLPDTVQVVSKDFVLCDDTEVLLQMNAYEGKKDYIVRYCLGEESEIVTEVTGTDGLFSLASTRSGDIFYVNRYGKSVLKYDDSGQKEEVSLSSLLLGSVWNPKEQKDCWYGSGSKGVLLWDAPNGQQVYPELEGVDRFDFQVGFSGDGALYLADKSNIYRYAENETKQIINFVSKDYYLDELCGLSVLEDGKIVSYAKYEEGEYILVAEERDIQSAPKKQEITIAIMVANAGIQRVVTGYNRKSDKYHVNLRYLKEGEDREDYLRKIQLELSAGKGPDLLSNWVMNPKDLAAAGYLRELEDVITDKEAFVSSALECGKINGVTYGIPYSCLVYTAVFPKEMVGEKEYWTVEEMMEAVERSNAEILMCGSSAMDIIMLCGLMDEDNTDYIDWKNKKSHLAEEPFLKLMEFAKKYEDKGQFPVEEEAERKRQGDIEGEMLVLSQVSQMDYGDACLGGKEVAYIGYPGAKKAGIYMRSDCLYMNQNSKNKEGVVDFLRYMLSEKVQNQYVGKGGFNSGAVSVRWSGIEYGIQEYQLFALKHVWGETSGGIVYNEDGLDEAQEVCYQRLLTSAKSEASRIDDLRSVIYEELQPFFEDKRSAKECADILHNRVQLYLNE